MNTCILAGRLAADAKVFKGKNAGNVVKMRLVTRLFWSKKDNAEKIAVVPVTVFGISDAQLRYLKKGARIGVVGSVRCSKFERGDAIVYVTDVVANKMGVRLM